jgi:hypothetical protein
MVTMATTVTNVRAVLDDTSTTRPYWSSPDIRTWINDAVREIARQAESILVLRSDLVAVPNIAKYYLPSDVIRLHRIEFVPIGTTQTYIIELRTYDELDQIWGIYQGSPSSYPSYGVVWGTPGNFIIQFYPVPSQSGIFNLYYYGMPVNLTTDGTNDTTSLQIPGGWDDLVVNYVEYRARRKAKDPTWQEAKALFDEGIQHLVDVTRLAHDNQRYMQQSVTSGVPGWLTGFGDE